MGHWSIITIGFESLDDEPREHSEVEVVVESGVRSAAHELPAPHGTQYSAVTGCFHVNCGEWFLRDDQDCVELHPDPLTRFLDRLTFDAGAAEYLTHAAVVESEDTGNSHRVTVYDIGGFEDATEIVTDTCHDGFDPNIDLSGEFGLNHRVRV